MRRYSNNQQGSSDLEAGGGGTQQPQQQREDDPLVAGSGGDGNNINSSFSHDHRNSNGSHRRSGHAVSTSNSAASVTIGGGLKPVPGRPRRRRHGHAPGGHGSGNKSRKKRGFWYRFYAAWVRPAVNTCSSLFLAVLLWYSLGILSIGTSKMLLMSHNHHEHNNSSSNSSPPRVGGVPPLFLTLQQLFLGTTLLRFLAEIKFMRTPGIQAWPRVSGGTATERRSSYTPNKSQKNQQSKFDIVKDYHPSLILAAVYFAFGFLATNIGFAGAPASFVETIKASEPITSATVAVLWGIEVLSKQEIISLGAIVAGVLLSTIGNEGDSTKSSVSESIRACLIVMASNLCFSFRGLYQKLLRATPEGSEPALDDLNLQFRMQQIGVSLLIIPVVVFELPSILRSIWALSTEHGLLASGVIWRYIGLALINGFAFTSYNLASTYILSRISVVHHAALNCIRRIFAIIVTSIIFKVPITMIGVFGVTFSFVGFMAFSHYKVQRQAQPKPLSSLLPISSSVK